MLGLLYPLDLERLKVYLLARTSLADHTLFSLLRLTLWDLSLVLACFFLQMKPDLFSVCWILLGLRPTANV